MNVFFLNIYKDLFPSGASPYLLVMSMMLKSKALCSLSLSYLKSQLGLGSFFFRK